MKKKLSQYLQKLFARKLVVTNEPGKCLIVIEVEKETSSIYTALGMSEERADELEKICHQTFHRNSNIVATIAEVSTHCLHANELYFVSFILTTIHAGHRNPAGIIQALLGRRG
jgi:hypothetical protein